jgi:hypothetical protein
MPNVERGADLASVGVAQPRACRSTVPISAAMGAGKSLAPVTKNANASTIRR